MLDQINASRNLQVALDLARAGAFVFPCQSSGPNKKTPCRGVYWKSVSTRDETKINALWRQHPDAIPGIDVGKSGFLVIDCDRKLNNGLAWFEAHAKENGDDLLDTPVVDTPSGGRHHFYQNSFTPQHGNSRGQLPPKKEVDIDVRGAGGFVIAPDAVFSDGSGRYTSHGSIFDAKTPPAWLRDLISPPKPTVPIAFTVKSEPVSDMRLAAYGEAALTELLSELASKQPGERNEAANLIAFRAGQLVGYGCLTNSSAQQSLEQAALSWGIRPNDKALGPKGTIARAIRDGQRSPRGPDDSASYAVEILLDHDPETGEVIEAEPFALDGELPAVLTRIPGLVGEIADWITDCAMYPQPALSLGAALTIVGTAAGRHLSGPTKSGTHLYVITLAPSGSGKDHPLTLIAPILAAADMRQHIGPSQFISMPAVINFLVRSPLSVCAMDEFGAFLKRINSKRASGFEGAISGMMRTAWGCSFKAMATPEWAGRASEAIFSPAMSIYGAVTAEEFYASLEGGDVTNGVLNRFLLIETKRMPDEVTPRSDSSVVPTSISEGLKAIYNRPGASMLCQSTINPAFDRLTISEGAEAIRKAMVQEIRAKGKVDPQAAPFFARTSENAIRLATIVAIGSGKTEIDEPTMAWAKAFALWSSETLAKGAGLYIADSDNQAMANAVRRVLEAKKGRIKRRDLIRALQHRYKPRELEEIIKALAEAEHLVIEKTVPEGGGTPTFWYSLGKNPA